MDSRSGKTTQERWSDLKETAADFYPAFAWRFALWLPLLLLDWFDVWLRFGWGDPPMIATVMMWVFAASFAGLLAYHELRLMDGRRIAVLEDRDERLRKQIAAVNRPDRAAWEDQREAFETKAGPLWRFVGDVWDRAKKEESWRFTQQVVVAGAKWPDGLQPELLGDDEITSDFMATNFTQILKNDIAEALYPRSGYGHLSKREHEDMDGLRQDMARVLAKWEADLGRDTHRQALAKMLRDMKHGQVETVKLLWYLGDANAWRTGIFSDPSEFKAVRQAMLRR